MARRASPPPTAASPKAALATTQALRHGLLAMGLGALALTAIAGAQPVGRGGTTVSGRITSHDGERFRSAAVTLTRLPVTDTTGPPSAAQLIPMGAFFIVDVQPGRYLLHAIGETFEDDHVCATQTVDIGTEAISRTALTLTPCAIISGQARVDSAGATPSLDLARVLVRAAAAGETDGVFYATRLLPDGTFSFVGPAPGAYLIRAVNLPTPWQLQAVTREGSDVTQTPLAIAEGQRIDDITLVLSDTGSQLRPLDPQPTPPSR